MNKEKTINKITDKITGEILSEQKRLKAEAIAFTEWLMEGGVELFAFGTW